MSDEHLDWEQSGQDYGVEPEVIAQFSDESEELLDSAANLFIRLEDNPGDEEAIHKVFRIVHTIKGNSAFFNLLKVKALAHAMEDLMNLVRRHTVRVTKQVIDLLIHGIDELKLMLNRVRNLEPETDDIPALKALISQIRQLAVEDSEAAKKHIWTEVGDTLSALTGYPDLPAGLATHIAHLQSILTQLMPEKPTHRTLAPAITTHFLSPEGTTTILTEQILIYLKDNRQIDKASAQQVHSWLIELKALLPEDRRDTLNEVLDVYHSVIDDLGFNDFLRDFIQEKLTGLAAGKSPVPPREEEDILRELSDMLNFPGQNGFSTAEIDRVGTLLKKLPGILEGEPALVARDMHEVFDSVIRQTGFNDFLKDYLLEKAGELMSVTKPAPVVIDKPVTVTPVIGESPIKPEPPEHGKIQTVGKTMRIAEADIDNFLDYVGELVILGEMFANVQQLLYQENSKSRNVSELKKTIEMFGKLSDSLRQSILDVRKIPIRTLFLRAPKIVRDIAGQQDKKIRVETAGDDLRVDKSLLETLDGPFSHLMRNAADHGIEEVGTRVRTGKPEEGLIRVSATENETDVVLTIEDDGAGINVERIKAKAIENGLISKDTAKTISDDDARMLIFAPGFSTAKIVTDVSGRGVGMDVVKRAIEGSGGRIEITSETGRGSAFILYLPKTVTVKIILGFLVGLGRERFVLPMDIVGETFRVTPDMINTVAGKGETILRHGIVYPVFKLAGLFYGNWSVRTGIGVMIKTARRHFVLLVDTVHGTRKVVIKDIQGLICDAPIITGGAILGNEEVAVVLDLEKIDDPV